jgi:Family of unknown function (DUF5761)
MIDDPVFRHVLRRRPTPAAPAPSMLRPPSLLSTSPVAARYVARLKIIVSRLTDKTMVLPYSLYARDGGRIDGSLRDMPTQFPETDSPTKLMPQVTKTCLSELFFSDDNIAALQQGLRYGVYRSSGGKHVIGNQSRDELVIIMRSIYLEHGRNLPFNVLEQVRELNGRVLDFAVPRLVLEVGMYQKYTVDSTTQPRPMEYGAYTSRAGLRGNGGYN